MFFFRTILLVVRVIICVVGDHFVPIAMGVVVDDFVIFVDIMILSAAAIFSHFLASLIYEEKNHFKQKRAGPGKHG